MIASTLAIAFLTTALQPAIAVPPEQVKPDVATSSIQRLPAVGKAETAGPPPVTRTLAAEPVTLPGGVTNEQNPIIVTAVPRNEPGDPLQDANVKSFAVIQAADEALVGPAARTYKRTLPKPIRSGLRNFLNNLHEPIVFLNFLLQIKPGKAAETVGRFAINSTMGGAGLFDVAKKRPFKLPRRPNGLANTLGYYGVKPGPYLVLPLIGATTLRDMVGGGLDGFVLPALVGSPFNSLMYSVPTGIIRGLDGRSEFRGSSHTSEASASDTYVSVRESYLRRRQAEIDELRGRRRAVPGHVP